MIHTIRDLLRVYRVRDWLHFLPLPLATYDTHAAPDVAFWAAARGVASAFAILAFGYLLNSVADRRMDQDARKNPLIIPGAGDPIFSLVGLLSASLVVAAFSPRPAQLATVLALIFFFVYSAGPRVKSVPVIGSLVNVVLFTPLLLLGMHDGVLPPGFAWVVLACAALVLETQFIHEAADQAEDRVGHVHTTWLTLGPRWTAVLASACGLLAAGGAAAIVPAFRSAALSGLVIAVFAIAFPLLLVRRGHDPRQAARLRLLHRWCGVLLGAAVFGAWRWAL